MEDRYTQGDRQTLLRVAREVVRAHLEARSPRLPVSDSPALRVPRACFVTLHREGALRGCVGTLTPRGTLWDAVAQNARAAAFEDPRFEPVTAEEEPALHIEISVLTEPEALAFASPEALLAALKPGIDGVLLRAGRHQATFLPQVWEQLPDPQTFLEHLSRKAGRPGIWRTTGTEILTYRVEAFEE